MKVIARDKFSSYYLVNEGMGSFLCPPGHPAHCYQIQDGVGVNAGSMSIEYAAECDYLPEAVRQFARRLIAEWTPGQPDPAWLDAVYRHMNHCYTRPNGDKVTFGKFWGNAELEAEEPAEYADAVRYIRKYYPDHQPDLKRMGRN